MSHKIFCLLGKSSTGKDNIFSILIADPQLSLRRLVTYTTRPIRTGEEEGREYHFVSEEEYRRLENAGLVVEERAYHTVYGLWRYFTVADGNIDLTESSCLTVGTLESFTALREYCRKNSGRPGFGAGEKTVVPLYIEVADGERLKRAYLREEQQEEPKYVELCRRFVADTADFAPEKLAAAGITDRDTFENPDGKLDECIRALKKRIGEMEEGA